MKNVTIKDVAKRLNVSISSVSRAFNNTHDIKKETRERILRVAHEMGYYPNPIAQKLVQNKTYNIGVVVPEFINEYYSEVIRGIQDILIPIDYQVLITQSDNNPQRELKNVKTTHGRVEEVKDTYDFIVSRAVAQMETFHRWVKNKVHKNQKHALKNGILYLKGGDLSEELANFPKATIYNLPDFFEEDFYETKKVVHLPMKFKG